MATLAVLVIQPIRFIFFFSDTQIWNCGLLVEGLGSPDVFACEMSCMWSFWRFQPSHHSDCAKSNFHFLLCKCLGSTVEMKINKTNNLYLSDKLSLYRGTSYIWRFTPDSLSPHRGILFHLIDLPIHAVLGCYSTWTIFSDSPSPWKVNLHHLNCFHRQAVLSILLVSSKFIVCFYDDGKRLTAFFVVGFSVLRWFFLW